MIYTGAYGALSIRRRYRAGYILRRYRAGYCNLKCASRFKPVSSSLLKVNLFINLRTAFACIMHGRHHVITHIACTQIIMPAVMTTQRVGFIDSTGINKVVCIY